MVTKHPPPPTRFGLAATAQPKAGTSTRHAPPPTRYGAVGTAQSKTGTVPQSRPGQPAPPPTRYGAASTAQRVAAPIPAPRFPRQGVIMRMDSSYTHVEEQGKPMVFKSFQDFYDTVEKSKWLCQSFAIAGVLGKQTSEIFSALHDLAKETNLALTPKDKKDRKPEFFYAQNIAPRLDDLENRKFDVTDEKKYQGKYTFGFDDISIVDTFVEGKLNGQLMVGCVGSFNDVIVQCKDGVYVANTAGHTLSFTRNGNDVVVFDSDNPAKGAGRYDTKANISTYKVSGPRVEKAEKNGAALYPHHILEVFKIG